MVFNVVAPPVSSVTVHLLVLNLQKYVMNIVSAMNMDYIVRKPAPEPRNVLADKFVTLVNVEASAARVSHVLLDKNVNGEALVLVGVTKMPTATTTACVKKDSVSILARTKTLAESTQFVLLLIIKYSVIVLMASEVNQTRNVNKSNANLTLNVI